MNKDSSFTYVHMRSGDIADLFDDFVRDGRLPDADVAVPPAHQPANPEDEDDVVPDQHAAFGIQRATQRAREREPPAWKDLGLAALMNRGGGGGGSGSRNGGGLGKPRGGGGAASVRSLPR